ncbi:MAG: M48 family metalloprotease [Betaproteobacteria bacterium]|nr:M48 family metalloprotease [Betaproteobacteria bacterium]
MSAAQTATKVYTEPEEIELGESIASGMLGAAPLLPNPGVQRYVNQVGRWLAAQSERPNLPWRFGVLDNEHVNAFAAPGGQILMTSGLLQRLNSEAELAGVLAHEIAHVVQKHQLDAIQKSGWTQGLQVAGGAMIDNKLAKGGALSQAARASGLGQAGADLLVDGFFARPLDRGLEYEADRMGVIIAARAGYDPYGFISVLQMMESLAKDSPFFALITKTHPSPTDRITELEKIAATLDRYQGGDQGAARFAAALGRAAPQATPAARPATPAQRPAASPAKAPAKTPAPAPKAAPGK